MSKNKAAQIGQDEVADAIDQAVSLAKARVADIGEAEVDGVSGGSTTTTIIMGYIEDVVKGMFE